MMNFVHHRAAPDLEGARNFDLQSDQPKCATSFQLEGCKRALEVGRGPAMPGGTMKQVTL